MLRRLDALRGHLAAAPVAAEEEEDEEPPILAALQAAGLDGEPLEKVSWEEIMAHNTPNDLWVVVDGAVFDMTDFITTDHPGGEEIPAEYGELPPTHDYSYPSPPHPGPPDPPPTTGGKDASEFWNDIHGHLKEEILEDVATGEGEWTGLDILPRIVGLADGPPPLAAQGRPQPLLWQQKNWSGFVQWSHGHGEAMLTPSTVEEVQEIVRSNNQVRVLGRGHGFPAICDQSHAEGVMVSLLPNMGRILEIDTERSVAVVEGGCVYRALVEQLEGTGLALQNTQSLSHITVAGGVATGSHGSSGVDPTTGRARLPSTATLISGLEIVIGDGSVVEYSRDRDTEIWGGLVTSLGCHGVVTKLTIDLVPDFDVHSFGYQGVSAETFLEHWDDMLNHPSCTSFNAMLRWPCETVGFGFQHFIPAGERALGPSEAPPVPETWYGEGAPRERAGWVNNNIVRWHQSVIGMSPKGIPEEFQLEFFVPLEHAVAALRATWQVAAEHWGEIVEPEDERPADAVGGGPAGGHIMNCKQQHPFRRVLSAASLMDCAFGRSSYQGRARRRPVALTHH